jgi:hypothetical protein
MNAPCPHHCPPGSGWGNGGPLAALIAVIVAVVMLAGPLSRAAAAALATATDVVEIAVITLGCAAALVALAALTVLARRVIRHRRGVVTSPVIAQPAQAHIAHCAPLTARPPRALHGRTGTWRPGDIPDRYPQQATRRAGRQAAAMTTWRTDDPCPVCGTGLHSTGDGTPVVRQDCPLCGWSATWHAREGR